MHFIQYLIDRHLKPSKNHVTVVKKARFIILTKGVTSETIK